MLPPPCSCSYSWSPETRMWSCDQKSGLIKSFSRGRNGVNISIKTVTLPHKHLCCKHHTNVESGEWAHRISGWAPSLRLCGSYSMSTSRRWGFEYRLLLRVDLLIRRLQWHWAELWVGRWQAKKEEMGEPVRCLLYETLWAHRQRCSNRQAGDSVWWEGKSPFDTTK